MGHVVKHNESDISDKLCTKKSKTLFIPNGINEDIPGEDNEKDQPYILEVNSSPGTKGFQEATKIDTIKNLLEIYKDKSNWWNQPTLCGVWETFEHEIFGHLIGKMDTGNSSETSVIHADEIDSRPAAHLFVSGREESK